MNCIYQSHNHKGINKKNKLFHGEILKNINDLKKELMKDSKIGLNFSN